ncbi:MAG: hypothetical protein PHG95_01690 [Patescibacteria group bacterium]|nr:hypothetical protein [Patescibacteria group bacterium]
MKTKIGLAAVKTLLAVIFLYNIGLFSLFSRIDSGPQPPVKPDFGKADRQYLHEKLQRAQSLGEQNYTPEVYFADLSDIRLREKRNEFDRFAVIEASQTINQLLSIFDRSIKFHRAHDSEKDYEILMGRISLERDKHERLVDPDSYYRRLALEKKMAVPGYWSGVLFKFLAWLCRAYLKNILLALVLIVIWWRQEKDSWKISNPFSFFICVVFYPVVIGRVWSRELRYSARRLAFEVEFRRRQHNLFALIADDELAYVRKFANSSLRFSDYRLRLDSGGLAIRHSLLPVILVTLVLSFWPRFGVAGHYHQDVVNFSCSAVCWHHPNITSFDDYSLGGAISGTQEFMPSLPLCNFMLFRLLNGKLEAGFRSIPDPIPLSL